MKGEDALAWDDGKGSKWRAFSFLSSGTGYQFTSVSDWTQKTEVDEQRSQSASVGTWAPACTHSRTESSPFAFTSSPQSPLLFEKQSYLSPGFQFTKQINLSPSGAQELVLGTCMARPGCAEVLEHGEFLQNDPTDPLLCKRHWKKEALGHFKHTWAVALFEKFWDLLGLRQKGESVGSWHHFQIHFCLKWLGNMVEAALLLET